MEIYNYIGNDLRKRYKELMDVESYREIKGFIQNEYIRTADINVLDETMVEGKR